MTKIRFIAEHVEKNGFCVVRDFLPAALLAEVQKDFLQQKANGKFRRAGTGQGKQIHDEIRRDEIYWIDQAKANPIQNQLFATIEELRQSLNQQLYLGLDNLEAHYSFYGDGGFYRKHLDSFRNNNARRLSMILYLTADWQPEHEGQLRLYIDNRHIDVEPIGGTLVCFLSEEIEHEVLANRAPRMSFTGWFRHSKP